jgi:hypothetical protein
MISVNPPTRAIIPMVFTKMRADTYGETIRIIPKIMDNIPPRIIDHSPLISFLNRIPVKSIDPVNDGRDAQEPYKE